MSIQPPPMDQIRQQFPEISTLEELKVGGFKVVYRAEIRHQVEAFKIVQLPPTGADEMGAAFRREVVARVKREIDILGKCDVPELVKLGTLRPVEIRIGDIDYVAYTEEFLDGQDLWDLIRSPQPYPNEHELRMLFCSLLRAVKQLWGHGYIHRDIKPGNVKKLTNPDRPFVLLDLGIAYSIRETALTYNPSERMPLATYRYIAPEMMNPNFRENLDYRSDLYCAGLTVYEYAAKQHPLARSMDDTIQTITRALREPPKPLRQFRADLSDEFCTLIDQMLKKRPALRPSNLERLIALMEGVR